VFEGIGAGFSCGCSWRIGNIGCALRLSTPSTPVSSLEDLEMKEIARDSVSLAAREILDGGYGRSFELKDCTVDDLLLPIHPIFMLFSVLVSQCT
jgi:hypothetical protein